MIVDSSAVVSILLNEDVAPFMVEAILRADRCRMTAPNYLEVLLVLQDRVPWNVVGTVFARLPIQIVPFDAELALVARNAFLRYGKGRHKARLNFGDCMAYALAKQTGEPLLFKGNDFAQTDIVSALA